MWLSHAGNVAEQRFILANALSLATISWIRCWRQFLGGWPFVSRQSLGRLLQDDRGKRMQERHGLASRLPDGTERGTSVRR